MNLLLFMNQDQNKINGIKLIIQKGIGFLEVRQKIDGRFSSYTSNFKRFGEVKETQSIFFTSLILYSLGSLSGSLSLDKLREKSIKFLMDERSRYCSWNYWKRNSPESRIMPYPDDLDDTCCALSAIYMNKKKAVTPKIIANVIALLTACECQEGGPYYTWLVSSEASGDWKDVDLAVNSNIAYFLSLQGIILPNLVLSTEKAIRENKYDSPYYTSSFSVIYFISRWYGGKLKKRIISYLLDRKLENNSWGDCLDTSLAICSLINLGYEKKELQSSIQYLINHQEKGKWGSYPFVVERIEKKKIFYSGGAELTTAFCLEALQKFIDCSKPIIRKKNRNKINKDCAPKRITELVIKETRKRFFDISPEMKKIFEKIQEKILKKDKMGEIILLPYYFQKSFYRKNSVVNEEILVKLGSANLYGWIAYAIYDDFFDKKGNPRWLSVANVCLREVTSIYYSLFGKNGCWPIFSRILDNMDNANSWEVNYCRAKAERGCFFIPDNFPDYKNFSFLSDRSMGHALGPIAILFLLGYKVDSGEVQSVLGFFRNYIIARQLNDDVHDWEGDLQRGNLSPVVTKIAVYIKKKYPQKTSLCWKKDKTRLQEAFWKEIVTDFLLIILRNTRQSKKMLTKTAAFKRNNELEKLLVPISKSARYALREQREIMRFLRAYSVPK